MMSGFLILAVSIAYQAASTKWIPLQMTPPKGIQDAKRIGAKPASDILHLAVSLPYRSQAEMQAFVDSVSDPKSENYRHFLTPDQVGRRFGLSPANVKSVSDYLESQGMKIKLISQNRISIVADATVAQAQTAFHTSIQEFMVVDQANPSGVKRFSFTTPPSVPASLKPYVTSISGLEDFTRPVIRRRSAGH